METSLCTVGGVGGIVAAAGATSIGRIKAFPVTPLNPTASPSHRMTLIVLLGFLPSLLLVLIGIIAANKVLIPRRGDPALQGQSIVSAMDSWDGHWYREIATTGYKLHRLEQSSLAFFPAFPLVGKGLSVISGMSVELSLVITANLQFLGAVGLFAAYLKARKPEAPRAHAALYAVLLLGLFPTTFYFHMAYTESMLLLLLLLAMIGMRRRWPLAAIAIIIGMATATRAVGIALLAPFALHIWERASRDMGGEAGASHSAADALGFSWLTQARRALVIGAVPMVVTVWGLLAFMAYQSWKFGDPLAFTEAQAAWQERVPPSSLGGKAVMLGTFEPIRSTYLEGSPLHWSLHTPHDTASLNLYFANPIYFLIAIVVVVAGAIQGRLNRLEWVLGLCLLLIPYVMQTGRNGMMSEARFASIVFPVYIVAGEWLSRLPGVIVCYLLALSGVFMAAYCVMFASGYPFV